MEIKIKGYVNIEPSALERDLEARLQYHGLSLKIENDTSFEGDDHYYHFGKNANDPVLLDKSTSLEPPYINYGLQIDFDCSNINKFVNKLNNKRYHKETIHIRFPDGLPDYKQFTLFFLNGKYRLIFMDDFEEFAIPFLTAALETNYGEKISTDFLDDGARTIEWIKSQKRARAPPLTPKNEFNEKVLSRDLVYSVVDEFARRLKRK